MDVEKQRSTLREYSVSFESMLEDESLRARSVRTLQINVGRQCNQTCRHCHVDASPNRTEIMERSTAVECIRILEENPRIEIVDITGGAPEINENFRFLVGEARRLGRHVIDRCNLTVLEEPGLQSLPEFLADHQVEIVASLPHYDREKTDRQRGSRVFEKSIATLRRLNALGYGATLPLNLVYNPSGFFLSSPQKQLEREFREKLNSKFKISFNNLYCINNLPINRFLDTLLGRGKYEEYMQLLVEAFNPNTVEALMCRDQISVGYDGLLYDCDFNQMLGMKSAPLSHIRDFDYSILASRSILTNNHCFGCTAGAGSSCGGEIAA